MKKILYGLIIGVGFFGFYGISFADHCFSFSKFSKIQKAQMAEVAIFLEENRDKILHKLDKNTDTVISIVRQYADDIAFSISISLECEDDSYHNPREGYKTFADFKEAIMNFVKISLMVKEHPESFATVQNSRELLEIINPTILFESEFKKFTSQEIASLKKNTRSEGTPNAKILIVQYSDLECPYCQKLHNDKTIQKIITHFDGQVEHIFKHFPLAFHENSRPAAESSQCIGKLMGTQGYYQYISAVFENGTAREGLTFSAESLGVDIGKYVDCVESEEIKDQVQASYDEAISLGASGTPTVIIINTSNGIGKLISGAYPYNVFEKAVNDVMK